MRQKLLKGMVAAVAMLAGALSLSAAIPENLYMWGTATTAGWDVGSAVQMTNEGKGVFTYNGHLDTTDLLFVYDRNGDADRIAPKEANSFLNNSNAVPVISTKGGTEFDYHWQIGSAGDWTVKVTFTEDSGTVNVKIETDKKKTIPENLYMCGPASIGWAAENGIELTKTQDGNATVFTYEGHLNGDHMIFMDNKGWQGIRYVPNSSKEVFNQTLRGGEVFDMYPSICGDPGNFESHWVLNDGCKWKLTVTFTTGDNVKFSAQKLQDTAGIPESLFMVGPATTAEWDISKAVEMTKTGEGVFTFEGDLYRTNIIFISGKDWSNVRYVPENGGTSLTDENKSIFISKDGGDSRHWMVDYAGIWKVTVTITEEGKTVNIDAERVSGPSKVVPLGAATGQWNSAETNNFAIEASTPGVYVYEWEVNESNTDDRHFKFISRTANWDSNIDYYMPEETDAVSATNSACKIKKVELDKEYPVTTTWVGGDLERYWSLPSSAQTSEDNKYIVTLNLNKNSIKFEKKTPTSIGLTTVNELKARFVGDALVVEGAGAGVAVYDISGRKVAEGNGDALTVNGLANGIYVVRTADAAVKIAK